MRIPGLASGMDIDSMVGDMLVKEKEKVDKAKQDQQVTKWKQEIYKDVIKDTKNLYDKYFSMTSSNSLLNSSNYSNMGISSSNSGVITATSGPGAEKVNYTFEITSIAKPPNFSIKLDPNKTIEEQYTVGSGNSTLNINGKEIEIKGTYKVGDIVKRINSTFSDGSVKATYSEMTGEFVIAGKETGVDSKLELKGDFLSKTGSGDEKGIVEWGENLIGAVLDSNGNSIKPLKEKSNSFTIDNITYNANSSGKAQLTSVTDTKKAVENMGAFVEDYNKLMDKMYDIITEKKPKDFKPLTEEQRKEMSEEEIKKWEEKSKEGILKNDSDMRRFMDDIQNVIFGSLEGAGISLSEMGITSSEDYNKKNQISFNPEKFSKALEEKGDQVYKALAGGVDGKPSMFDRMKDTLYKYSGSSTSIFAKKAGMGGASEDNNIFAKDIKKQETKIKELTRKMENKEQQLYSKFAALESVLNKYNSQMGYFMQSMGM